MKANENVTISTEHIEKSDLLVVDFICSSQLMYLYIELSPHLRDLFIDDCLRSLINVLSCFEVPNIKVVNEGVLILPEHTLSQIT